MSNQRLRLLAYVAIVVVTAFAVYKVSDRAIDRERTAQIAACERVQILRDQANGTNLLVFRTFSGVLAQQESLLKKVKTSKDRKQALVTMKRARRVVETTVVTGPTDCRASVDHPNSYHPPAPQFIVEGGMRMKIIRQRSNAIVRYAERHKRLPPVLDDKGRPITRLP